MQKRTILVVEDDDRFVKMLSFLFGAKGFEVKAVNNGLDAWQYLEEKIPSLIILDLIMPYMDGFSLFRKIKKEEKFKNIPIIILSGLGLNEIAEKMDASELVYYLRKPFRTADILSLTDEALHSNKEKSAHHGLCSDVRQYINAD